MTHEHDALFRPFTLGDLALPNRVVMAPLTRSRAKQPGDIPWELNATYYAQRAGAGLIIAEATQVSPQGKGYAFTPGIHSDEQVAGWRKVTTAVHEAGGRIHLQLWHVGRISRPELQPDGAQPVAPSAIRPEGAQTFIDATSGMVDVLEPRALDAGEMPGIVEQYRRGAENAKRAGFDGVEIHAANGYLLDQFIRSGSNRRDDAYGGSLENRLRLPLMVVDAVTQVWGGERTGVRVSPTGTFNDMHDDDPVATYGALAARLQDSGLAYIEVVEDPFMGNEENGRPGRSSARSAMRFAAAISATATTRPTRRVNASTPVCVTWSVSGDRLFQTPTCPSAFAAAPRSTTGTWRPFTAGTGTATPTTPHWTSDEM
jgi:N-ethylmaleimide reductase